MAGIRGRLGKLEQEAEGLYETLTLEDGTKIRCDPGEMFEALSAVIVRSPSEHPLLPHLRAVDTTEGMPGLIRALEASHARREGGGRDGA
jgi:hypothetical protein